MQYHVQMLVTLELTDVTLEVGPGQSEGQGEGGADQTITAQSPGHPGVRPVILIREKYDSKVLSIVFFILSRV